MGLFCGKGSPDCTVYLQGQGCGRYEADSGKQLVLLESNRRFTIDTDIAGIGVSNCFHLMEVDKTYAVYRLSPLALLQAL